MDPALVGALAGVLGSLAGGSATVAAAWVAQKTQGKRELAQAEIHKREKLYGEFIGECSRLLMDALSHNLEEPQKLVTAYELLNRIRLSASDAVLAEAEHIVRRITDQYSRRTFRSSRYARSPTRMAASIHSNPSARRAESSSRRCRAPCSAPADGSFLLMPRLETFARFGVPIFTSSAAYHVPAEECR